MPANRPTRDFVPRPRVLSAVVTCLLALALVLPNHTPPWMSFMQEALAASALALLALACLVWPSGRSAWRAPDLLAFAFVILIATQLATGQILFLQSAWMPTLYLVGFHLASQTGAVLERKAPGRVTAIVVVAFLIAGLASVALQAYQLLGSTPGSDPIWVYRYAGGGRPAANLGQPNLLATVQVLGALGAFWLWKRGSLSGVVAVILCVTSLAGIALTQSRTGLLNVWISVLMLTTWNTHDPKLRLILPGLGIVATALFVGYMQFGDLLAVASGAGLADRGGGFGTRPFAWGLFTEAIGRQPLAGYGWGQAFAASLAVAPGYEALPELWLHTHNLLLDLAVWNGLPVALAAAAAMAVWLAQCVRGARDDGGRLLLLIVTVGLVHAMLEYPLSYAYVLLPMGLAAGALGERTQAAVVWRAPNWIAPMLVVLALAGMALTVRDYLRVEHTYRQLLLEKARIRVLDGRDPPDVVVLTSLRDLIAFSRLEPSANMSESQLTWMTAVVKTHPGAHGFAKLARATALNGRISEAQYWVDNLCRIFSTRQCRELAEEWDRWAEAEPQLRGVRWK
jgi:hypothetical protein